MTITSLKSALQRIAQLEQENEQLRAELEVYKNRNTGGRKKHDEAWIPVSRIRTFTLSGRVSLSKARLLLPQGASENVSPQDFVILDL